MDTSLSAIMIRLYNKQLFKILLFVPVIYGLNSWATPLISLADQPYPASALVSKPVTSPFSLRVLHQGMVSQVQIALDYGVKDNNHGLADDTLMHEAARLLMSYPEKYDYWEVVNLAITQSLLEIYPQLDYVTLQLEILPSDRIHYRRASTVTRWPQGDVNESWRFEVQELPIQGRTLTAAIDYSYTDTAIYPDYLDICRQLIEYLNAPLTKNMPLEQLEHTLGQHLLHHYSGAIADISIRLD